MPFVILSPGYITLPGDKGVVPSRLPKSPPRGSPVSSPAPPGPSPPRARPPQKGPAPNPPWSPPYSPKLLLAPSKPGPRLPCPPGKKRKRNYPREKGPGGVAKGAWGFVAEVRKISQASSPEKKIPLGPVWGISGIHHKRGPPQAIGLLATKNILEIKRPRARKKPKTPKTRPLGAGKEMGIKQFIRPV